MNIRVLFKKRNIIVLIIALVVAVYAVVNKGDKEPGFEFVIAERGSISHEVSVTGSVKAAQSVDLAFETGGRVKQILVKVGDKAAVGAQLITLESGVLSAQLLQAQANLEAEQALLNELKRGTRPEEIQSAETVVSNAQRALNDEQTNLANVKEKADADLNSSYDSALTALQKAVSVGKTALITLTDIQYAHFTQANEEGNRIATAKASAVLALLGAQGAGSWKTEYISPLEGGAFGLVQDAVADSTRANIDQALAQTISALRKTQQALDAVPITDSLTSTQKTNLSTEKTNISAEITSISGKEQAVAVQKASNQNAIAAAQEGVTTAENTLMSARDTLALKRAGSTPEQISAQEAKVKSAQANAQNYQAQIAKTILRSPINGVITKQDAKVGEIVAANSNLVSVISEAEFQIEANVTEVDIAGIAIGNLAKVTLDAYSSDDIFEAKVIAIDPAETVIEGVSTYKVTLQFIKEDKRVKSGMTANIDILTDTKENVLAIPQRAVIRKNGDKMARVLKGEEIQEVIVETGLRGLDARVEIISGINEGDKVITFMEEKR